MPGLGCPILHLYSDGASRGNPGPAAAGAVIKDEQGLKVAEVSRYLGAATNNQAEYEALIAALEVAAHFKPRSLKVHLDSDLVVKQLSGEYRMKNPGLRPLLERTRQLLCRFEDVSITHIPGELNGEAHALAGMALRKRAVG